KQLASATVFRAIAALLGEPMYRKSFEKRVAIDTNTCTLTAMDRHVERVVEAVHAITDVTDLESLQALINVHDVLEARLAEAARRLDQEGAPAVDGAVNMAHWLRTRCGQSDRDARQLMRRSARLAGCPAR